MMLFEAMYTDTTREMVNAVLDRKTWWTNGQEVAKFENQIAALSNRKYGVAFNSGTSALYSLLMVWGISNRKVIVPSFTFPATVNAVVLAGGIPVFADIEEDTFGLDVADVVSKITANTSLILPIHFAGNISRDILKLGGLDIPLVEDAAHSLMATKHGQAVGSFGEAAMFSFCFNKLITTGEGGMIVTDDVSLVKRLCDFRSHGKGDMYQSIGYNFRMSSIAAALGLGQLVDIAKCIGIRDGLASTYDKGLGDIEEITLIKNQNGVKRINLYYNILVENRDALAEYLIERYNIPTRVIYHPVHLYPYYKKYNCCNLPVTTSVYNRILSLPLHPNLLLADVRIVIDAIREFCGSL